jgi:3-methyladenine DNA glycosylase AlkC
MAELLKHAYNAGYMQRIAECIKSECPAFESDRFIKSIFDDEWEGRELKSRMDHIARSLNDVLALDYLDALPILLPASETFGGFEGMFFPHFVELYGQKHWDESIVALEHMTKFSSAEFAVRPFIIKAPKKMMKQMGRWSKHDNYHVRRLSSEGCRPRLPWAMALPEFKKDPSLIFPILERLKKDDSEYVRKSVANNMNDITKDHPQKIKHLAKHWLGDNQQTDWIVKHGCRTLLKSGDPEALSLFGYEPANNVGVSSLSVSDKTIKIGDDLNFSFLLSSQNDALGKLRIEYGIDYVKANGSLSRKVFKLSEGVMMDKKKIFSRKQTFREMSTRKHYAGKHGLAIIINGVEVQNITFMVTK